MLVNPVFASRKGHLKKSGGIYSVTDSLQPWRVILRALELFMLLSLVTSCASNIEPRGAPTHGMVESRHLSLKKEVLPPFGFVKMCVDSPGLCENKTGRLANPGTKVHLNRILYNQLVSVNAAVNRKIKPVRDGKIDNWQIDPTRGDCEDYALTKKSELLHQGWPSSALAIAVVRTRQRAKHAVLVVHTDKGSFVLDNLSDKIVPTSVAPYQLISMQILGPGTRWAGM
jgi:predicted transglutaminase-like cysteine proteinase